MRNYTKLEIATVVGGAFLIAFGLVMMVHPTTIMLLPENPNAYPYTDGVNLPVGFSKSSSHVVGVLCIIGGVGISWLTLGRRG